VVHSLTNSVKNTLRQYQIRKAKLNLKKKSVALALILIITLSSIALLHLEKRYRAKFDLHSLVSQNSDFGCQFNSLNSAKILHCTTISLSQSIFGDNIKKIEISTINNSTRAEVFNFIVSNPGTQFRGICAGLGIAIGSAEFHLGVLKKAGLISYIRDGKYKRFFASKSFSRKEMQLISLLRHKTIREILKKLTMEKNISHCKLASFLSITSQGLSWQMNRLREEGIIQQKPNGIRIIYAVSEPYVSMLPQLISLTE
jgi:predicted transcriptional regulator